MTKGSSRLSNLVVIDERQRGLHIYFGVLDIPISSMLCRLWFDELVGFWDSCHNSPSWEQVKILAPQLNDTGILLEPHQFYYFKVDLAV